MELSKSAKRGLLRVQKAVDKFNQLRAEAAELMGGEDGVYYDNSSTFDSGPCYMSELRGPYVEEDFNGKGPAVVIRCKSDDGRGNIVNDDAYAFFFDDGEGSLDFNDDDMVFDINYRRRGVNRAMRYFREYNPSDEDEEGNNRKWESSETARDVEEGFIVKTNNKHIINEEFGEEFAEGPRMDLVNDMKRTVLAKAMEYDGRVSRRDLEYSLRKYYPEATDEEIEMAINGDEDIYGESVDANRAFNASTFSRMVWLGEDAETTGWRTEVPRYPDDRPNLPKEIRNVKTPLSSRMKAWPDFDPMKSKHAMAKIRSIIADNLAVFERPGELDEQTLDDALNRLRGAVHAYWAAKRNVKRGGKTIADERDSTYEESGIDIEDWF